MPRYQHLLSLGMPRAARLTAEKNVVCSSRHDGLRISFHVYNTVAGVDAVLGMLQQNLELFAETPALYAD
jgi:selenocysteine lyase/cysteine desulfurase